MAAVGHVGEARGTRDKKLRTRLQRTEGSLRSAAQRAKRAEVLLQEEVGFLEADAMERTFHFTQDAIVQQVDLNSARKSFNLTLDQLGPYAVDYTRSGRHLLIGGRKGHVAMFDWQASRLRCEIQVKEAVRDVQFLHNETMFAVAQKKYTYIYDGTGTEVHCLKHHVDVHRLQFLPYHYLLASVGEAGYLKYQDTSTGQLVAELRTRLGPCHVLRQNPHNAIMHCGHQNGTVTLWSPTMTTPLVKMLCHKGPLLSIAMDRNGYNMVTSGMDSLLRVWDIRTYKVVHSYFTTSPATAVDVSQTGLLGVGFGPHVQIWKDAIRTKASAPYMNHLAAGTTVRDIAFCPFEDVLGLGHSKGVSSILVPGAGEPNLDTLEANPFQTRKQRQEAEVKTLLDKIQPEMITLDPSFVGHVDRSPAEVRRHERRIEWEANHPGKTFVEEDEPDEAQKHIKKLKRRLRRKQPNVIDENREALRKQLEDVRKAREAKRRREEEHEGPQPRTALDRFKRARPE